MSTPERKESTSKMKSSGRERKIPKVDGQTTGSLKDISGAALSPKAPSPKAKSKNSLPNKNKVEAVPSTKSKRTATEIVTDATEYAEEKIKLGQRIQAVMFQATALVSGISVASATLANRCKEFYQFASDLKDTVLVSRNKEKQLDEIQVTVKQDKRVEDINRIPDKAVDAGEHDVNSQKEARDSEAGKEGPDEKVMANEDARTGMGNDVNCDG
uniref:Uncharacterized protein n=1 Tax=Arundo donax TaxID=35708 RepID=A0A0A9ETD1_ARUDO